VCNEKREVEYKMEFSPEGARFGPDGYSVSLADGYIITCSKLYELLLHRIPKDRIHFGKKVLTEAEDNILVGADGAHSAVRQGLYSMLKAKKPKKVI
ncbi:hypothetical protein BGX23_004573, partial [Mortierella sp. AD031]